MSISNSPQNFKGGWYYENRGSIDVIIPVNDLPLANGSPYPKSYRNSDGMVQLRIPAKLLRKTIARQAKNKPGPTPEVNR